MKTIFFGIKFLPGDGCPDCPYPSESCSHRVLKLRDTASRRSEDNPNSLTHSVLKVCLCIGFMWPGLGSGNGGGRERVWGVAKGALTFKVHFRDTWFQRNLCKHATTALSEYKYSCMSDSEVHVLSFITPGNSQFLNTSRNPVMTF